MAEQIEVKRTGAAERARPASEWSYRPDVDILEDSDAFTIVADIPGADAGTVDVTFENGTLRVHAPVSSRRPGMSSPLIEEYGVGDFDRQFGVFDRIESGEIRASFADGVLTIRLPKMPSARRRTIPVKIG
jgi:HSP20 family protein